MKYVSNCRQKVAYSWLLVNKLAVYVINNVTRLLWLRLNCCVLVVNFIYYYYYYHASESTHETQR